MDFGRIIKKALDATRRMFSEGFEKDGYLYVYHMTDKKSLEGGVYKTGFERYFTGKNSNAYGPGVYTTLYPSFDKRADVRDSYGRPNPELDKNRGLIYGKTMIKLRVKKGGVRNFLVFDERMAKIMYKDNWKIEDQLKVLLKPETLEHIKANNKYEYDRICFGSENYTRGYGASAAASLCAVNHDMNRSIRGYIFHGPGDGFVAIFKDFSCLTPVGESDDYGHTFKPIKLDPKFDEYVTNNVDLRREFGAEYQYDNKTGKKKAYRNAYYDEMPAFFTNGYARVKKNGKYNYLYYKTYKKGLISNVWFDEAPVTFNSMGIAWVIINGEKYAIKNKNDVFIVYDENGKYLSYLNDFQPNGQNNVEPQTADFSDYSGDDDDFN